MVRSASLFVSIVYYSVDRGHGGSFRVVSSQNVLQIWKKSESDSEMGNRLETMDRCSSGLYQVLPTSRECIIRYKFSQRLCDPSDHKL